MHALANPRRNPLPALAWIVGGTLAGGAVVFGTLAAISKLRSSGDKPPPPGRDQGAPVWTRSGMRLRYPGWCDIQATDDNAFFTFLAEVSADLTGQWPPPTPRDEEVIALALRRAFPQCTWPPTDPGWRFHGSQPGDAMTWAKFIASMHALLEEAFAGTLPWGPKPYQVR